MASFKIAGGPPTNRALQLALVAAAATACGGGPAPSTSGGSSSGTASSTSAGGTAGGAGSSSGGSGGSSGGSPYDTFAGTFTSGTGIEATVAGSLYWTYPGGPSPGSILYSASFADAPPGRPDVTVTNPTGATATFSFASAPIPGAPSQQSFSCTERNFTSAFSVEDGAVYALANGNPLYLGTCALTISSLALVSPNDGGAPGGTYALHGTLTETMATADGSDNGTLTATF